MMAGPSSSSCYGDYYEESDDDEMVNLDFIDIAEVLLADFVDMVIFNTKFLSWEYTTCSYCLVLETREVLYMSIE